MQKGLGLTASHQQRSTYFTTIILSVDSCEFPMPCSVGLVHPGHIHQDCPGDCDHCDPHRNLKVTCFSNLLKSYELKLSNGSFLLHHISSSESFIGSTFKKNACKVPKWYSRYLMSPKEHDGLKNHILGYSKGCARVLLHDLRRFHDVTTHETYQMYSKANTLCLPLDSTFQQTSSLYQLWMQLDCSLAEATAAASCQKSLCLSTVASCCTFLLSIAWLTSAASSLEGLLLHGNSTKSLLEQSFQQAASFNWSLDVRSIRVHGLPTSLTCLELWCGPLASRSKNGNESYGNMDILWYDVYW